MKHVNRIFSFVLVFAMIVSLGSSYTAKAAGTVTVTLRIEQDDATLLSPVSVTLTEEDKNNDFGIGLSTGNDAAQSPLRAYAKYLAQKGVSNEEMTKYIMASPSAYGGLYVSGISLSGDGIGAATSSSERSDVYWMYNVNHETGMVSMSEYDLKDSDSVVIYGLWSPWPAEEETLYTAFDKDSYTSDNNQVTVSLTGYGTSYDENGNATPFTKAIENASVIATNTADGTSCNAVTNAEGKAVLAFPETDTTAEYILTAYKKSNDGSHYTISRPYAKVSVTPQKVTEADPMPLKRPAKVKSLTAKVTNKKKKKKSITLSWKKVSGAKGYRVYISSSAKKGYRKTADVKKTKVTIKKKKGTYYFKVAAYNKENKNLVLGTYSRVCRVKVK